MSITLDNLAGTAPAGYAGLEDGVDWHWDRIFAGAVLTTLLSIGAGIDRYAALHAQTYGEPVDAATLIPHMLKAFMVGDRGFKKEVMKN